MSSSMSCANSSTKYDTSCDAPTNCIRLTHFYRNQPTISSEITLRFEPIVDELFLSEEETSLRAILFAAGILTKEELALAVETAISNSTKLTVILPSLFNSLSGLSDSLNSLAAKIVNRTLSFPEGVIAAHHLFLTRGRLADALLLVGKLDAYSVVDFLIDVGCIRNIPSELLTANVKFITKSLLKRSVINESTLRVATRLRYLVSLGTSTLASAIRNFRLYQSERVEPEEFEPFKIMEI